MMNGGTDHEASQFTFLDPDHPLQPDNFRSSVVRGADLGGEISEMRAISHDLEALSCPRLVIPGVGVAMMGARTRADEPVVTGITPRETTIKTGFNDRGTGDYGLVRVIGGEAVALVVDPVSGGGVGSPQASREFVEQAYDRIRGEESSALRAARKIVEVADEVHQSMLGGGNSFTFGVLALGHDQVTLIRLGDAGQIYVAGRGFLQGVPLDKLGRRDTVGGRERFVPYQVGFHKPSSYMSWSEYDRSWWREREIMFGTDVMSKLAGYRGVNQPQARAAHVLDMAFRSNYPPVELLITKNRERDPVDDGVVVYFKIEGQ